MAEHYGLLFVVVCVYVRSTKPVLNLPDSPLQQGGVTRRLYRDGRLRHATGR